MKRTNVTINIIGVHVTKAQFQRTLKYGLIVQSAKLFSIRGPRIPGCIAHIFTGTPFNTQTSNQQIQFARNGVTSYKPLLQLITNTIMGVFRKVTIARSQMHYAVIVAA